MNLIWVLISILVILVIVLFIKLWLIKKNINNICVELKEQLSNDSNTIITISSRNKYIKELATQLNNQLLLLYKQRQRYLTKELEIQASMTNISHDLRTPLTSIYGYLELLEKTEKSEIVCRYVDVIKNRTELLKQLTEELFQYSMIMVPQNMKLTEGVAINPILEESIARFYDLLRENNIIPNIHITEKKVIRNLNQIALTRVFENLLSNAIKYSDGELNITLTETGKIIFSNTASKLDEVQLGQLFHRFYTIKNQRKSTGLGLAITKTLIEQMNGSISARYENHKLYIEIYL